MLYMPSVSSHVIKSQAGRKYRGEEEAHFLLSQLNDERTIDHESLRQLILALQELGDCRPITRQRFWGGDPTQGEEMRKIKAVNKFLRRYEAWPRLRQPSPFGGTIRLEWRSTPKSNTDATRLRRDANLELKTVLIAVELAQEGRIASLKQCANPNCKRWLFARFKHQKFCSEACYELFHRTDPQEKKRRCNWAKENYRSRKELELGSRKAAQRKVGKR
jgi:hypothetical protein